MEATEALRRRLRKLLNEMIPEGGRDTDTNFTDVEIIDLLTEADSIYAAASAGWIEKAALLQGDIESYSSGTEKYDLTSLNDRLGHAQAMIKHYADLADDPEDTGGGALMIRVQPKGWMW